MNWYKHSGNIKAGLFILALVMSAGLLVYSQHIVAELREDNREIVKLYAEIIANTAADVDDTNLDFVFEEIIKKVQFPIIYSDVEHLPVFHRNLPSTELSNPQIQNIQAAMDRQNDPIPLLFVHPESNQSLIVGYLHFGDSRLIRQLQWLPYLEIGAIALFVLLGFAGFSIIRNSEKRFIWVGMARETAHQLGTPVSALLGWLERLKTYPEKSSEIVTEMAVDMERLQQVGDRFSRMGSAPVFTPIALYQQVETVADYLRRRLPSTRKNIRILNEIDRDISIRANGILLSWAIENVMKNAIDAIEGPQGEIRITLAIHNRQVTIQIADNGRGIARKHWRNIFRPGYSTKKGGWGLGLSLTKRIVEEIHRGKIQVSHSEPGQGTTIDIVLPADRDTA